MRLQIIAGVAFTMGMALLFQVNGPGDSGIRPQGGALGSRKVISRETYARVVDMVFPRDGEGHGHDFILRFEPSFAPESQIVVRNAVNKIEVLEYTSLSGNIYKKLNSVVAHGGEEDAVAMAKLIQVRKRLVEVPITQALQWRDGFADSVGNSIKTLEQRSAEAAKGVGTVTIDGTFYSLWYDPEGSHISISVWDHEISDREITGELRLVRWMNAVRRDVEKLK